VDSSGTENQQLNGPEGLSRRRAAAAAAGPVCILGLGLIGGSLLRALDGLRTGGDVDTVGPSAPLPAAYGWNRSPATVEAARAAGHDVSADLDAVLARARADDALVVVGVPMPAVDTVLARIAEAHPGALLTDVVSVKGPVLESVRAAGLVRRYVGSHPMAGTSSTGWAATDPSLFEGSTWVITSDGGGAPSDWRRVAALGSSTGSRLVALPSDEHDAAVARVSHLPHVFAESLAASGAAGGRAALALGAGSFRDGTRVAGTPADLVRAICEPNAAALESVLAEAIEDLQGALAALRSGDTLGDLVERGAAGRAEFEEAHSDSGGSAAVPIVPGTDDWLEAAIAAGRKGRGVEVEF